MLFKSRSYSDGYGAVARFVKFVIRGNGEKTDGKDKHFTAGELRIYGDKLLPTTQQLERLIVTARQMVAKNKLTSAQAKSVQTMIKDAEEAVTQTLSPEEVEKIYWALYNKLTVAGAR